jgi:hypothetical protein
VKICSEDMSKEEMTRKDQVAPLYLVRLNCILVATKYHFHLLSGPLTILPLEIDEHDVEGKSLEAGRECDYDVLVWSLMSAKEIKNSKHEARLNRENSS